MATVKRNKSAEKRARQSVKRRRRNRIYKAAVKEVVKTAKATTPETATADLKKATKVLSRLAAKGVLHKNTAARRISKLVRNAAKAKSA